MCSKLKIFLLTGFFLLIATAVFAEPFWYFHTGHTIKYTRAKSDGTNWIVTMTIGDGGQSQCSRNDYYKVDEYNYDNDGKTKTMYLRITEDAGYQCEGGTTEIKFFQTGTEGTTWQYPPDLTTDGVRFQIVGAQKFGTQFVIRRQEIQSGNWQPSVFTYFTRGFGLWKELDNWAPDNAPWTQGRHGCRGRTLYATFSSGLYVYDFDGAGTWTQISSTIPANMVATPPVLYATWTGQGLFVWDGSTWTRLSTLVPSNMVVWVSKLYATWTGQGLFVWDGSTWTRISNYVPTSMVASGSYLYATFTGLGLYKWDGSSWAYMTSLPTKMVSGQN